MSTIKAFAAGVLLLAVFSLPTLTATQLVTVLGEKTAIKPLTFQLENSVGVFRKFDGGVLTVSYLKPGLFPVLSVTNPNPISKIIRINLGEAQSQSIAGQSVTLSVANSNYRLYDHTLQPYNPSYDLVIPAGASRRLELLVQGGEGSGTVTMKLLEY